MKSHDIVIVGNYSSDTIIKDGVTEYSDGGGVYYGAFSAVGSGVDTAAVTRLARTDNSIVNKLEKAGITVYPTYTNESTHLVNSYSNKNVDERTVICEGYAGPFTPDQFEDISSKVFIITALFKGEVNIELIKYLHKTKHASLALDVQGFVRVIGENSVLHNTDWPNKEEVLSMINFLKTDAVEAESLTGEKDRKKAAKILADCGPDEIVMTHKNGILVYSHGEFYEANFHLKEIIGRTGRGDTCFASYISKRLSTPADEAIVWSAAVTSLKMEKEGPFIKSTQDVEELINRSYR